MFPLKKYSINDYKTCGIRFCDIFTTWSDSVTCDYLEGIPINIPYIVSSDTKFTFCVVNFLPGHNNALSFTHC